MSKPLPSSITALQDMLDRATSPRRRDVLAHRIERTRAHNRARREHWRLTHAAAPTPKETP